MTAHSMVERYLRPRGIFDERVLSAMLKVPRHLFVPDALRERAYSDHPLPIGADQTISQPFIVALMTQALELTGQEKILEIGTGSGYQAAILAELAKSVFSIERVHALGSKARKVLESLSYHNVSIRVANGTLGWSEFAPYDRIIVTASAIEVPPFLVDQLGVGGRMVIPVGTQDREQKLFLLEKHATGVEKKFLSYCNFVPCVA